MLNVTYNKFIEKIEKDEKDDIVNKLKTEKISPLKFKLQKFNNNYVSVFIHLFY
jgi:uncharacterized membrane protein YqhA